MYTVTANLHGDDGVKESRRTFGQGIVDVRIFSRIRLLEELSYCLTTILLTD